MSCQKVSAKKTAYKPKNTTQKSLIEKMAFQEGKIYKNMKLLNREMVLTPEEIKDLNALSNWMNWKIKINSINLKLFQSQNKIINLSITNNKLEKQLAEMVITNNKLEKKLTEMVITNNKLEKQYRLLLIYIMIIYSILCYYL